MMLARFIVLHCASAGKKFPTVMVRASASHPTRRRREMDSNCEYRGTMIDQRTKSLRDSQLKRLICGPAKQDTDRR